MDKRYSQHEIETYLERVFFTDKPGFFLEIGCWDGEMISQTAWLEREKGWHGVCVDPFPRNFEKRTCRVCPKAISLYGEPRLFVKVSIDRRYGGDVSYFSGFKDSIGTHWPLIQEFCDYEEIGLATITFKQLVEEYNLPSYIDFLSVDTEGSEPEIFQAIDFKSTQFGLIVFEHNQDRHRMDQIERILIDNRYVRLASLVNDDIYIHQDHPYILGRNV